MSSAVQVGAKTGRARMGSSLTHVILIIASVLMIFPFVWQILMSLSTNAQVASVPPTVWPGTLHWENFAHVFEQLPFLNQLWVSVAVTVITGFQLFDLLYALMGTQNPAINQTQSMVYLFFAHQQTGDNGYAAAVGVAILLLVGVFTILQFRMQRRWVNYV